MLGRFSTFARRHRLEFISFITGFSLLTYELAAARVLAPSIGSSTYVWTGVIGVIIAALSLGFFVGGKVADSRNTIRDLVWLLFIAAITTIGTLLIYESMLDAIVDAFTDSRVQAVAAALTLFAPASFFIGMTSPYLAKLNVLSLRSTGQSIASLDMFNAVGGISGTFVTGFILFGYIGAHQAIGLVAILLLLASWLILPSWQWSRRLLLSLALLLYALTPPSVVEGLVRIDTASSHYQVISGYINNQPVTGLITGPNGTQSAVYTNGRTDLVFWYTNEISRLTAMRQPSTVLILGGGAFTLPQYLSSQLPGVKIDAVEIDPTLKSISEDYFGYRNPSNVREIFTDARAYVNSTDRRYDAIIVDVYGDTAIPFSFITKEYGEALNKILNPDGVVIANVIGGFTGPCREAFAAVDAAYRSSLPYVQYSNESGRREQRANQVVVYSREPIKLPGLQSLPSFGVVPYTDNFAPSERLYHACQQAA
ncbi:MAG: fused MFS/spermidine synthase [Candidatus Saccharimonadales bacterium]